MKQIPTVAAEVLFVGGALTSGADGLSFNKLAARVNSCVYECGQVHDAPPASMITALQVPKSPMLLFFVPVCGTFRARSAVPLDPAVWQPSGFFRSAEGFMLHLHSAAADRGNQITNALDAPGGAFFRQFYTGWETASFDPIPPNAA